MNSENDIQLKKEIEHIFESGANETRIYEMVKNFIDKRNLLHNDKLSNSFVRDTEEILESNEKRFVSHSTGMKCAKCGEEFKITNRHILPFEFEKLNDNIGRIWIPCPRCNESYDLGICRHT